jgi:hypothetical protein
MAHIPDIQNGRINYCENCGAKEGHLPTNRHLYGITVYGKPICVNCMKTVLQKIDDQNHETA